MQCFVAEVRESSAVEARRKGNGPEQGEKVRFTEEEETEEKHRRTGGLDDVRTGRGSVGFVRGSGQVLDGQDQLKRQQKRGRRR